jgi:hypothetical protein
MDVPSALPDQIVQLEPLDAPQTTPERLIRGIVLGGFLLVLTVEAWLLLHVWSLWL